MRRMNCIALCLVVLISCLVFGCIPTQPEVVAQKKVVPVPEVQYVDAALIEGKTTKQEVLDMLGMPESIGDTLNYDYGDKKDNLRARIHIVQKDGTEYNVILGHGLKYRRLSVYFHGSYNSQGKHIPSNKNTSISIN